MQANLRLIDELTREAAQANDEVRRLFAADQRLRRLLPIPGIGPLIAATVLVEIGDIARFASPDHLCSWAGLTPTERTSHAHTRRGHISKQGSRWLRWAMVEAAQRAGGDAALGRLYQPVADRRGRKIARVALARRILTLCFYALRDARGCRAYPAKSRTVVEARSPVVMPSRTPRRPRR